MTFSPGSIYIRPTREDAENCPDAFYAFLKSIKTKLTYKQLASVVDPDAIDNVSGVFRKVQAKSLTASAREAVLRYVFDKAQLFSRRGRAAVQNVPDAAYFALLNFLSVKETSQDMARARLVGTYRFWRFSMEHQGEFVSGRLTIEEDQKTHVLRADVLQVRKGDPCHVGVREHFRGYVFRVAHMYVLFMRNTVNNAVRMTLLSDFQHAEVGTAINPASPFRGRVLHVVSLDGHELGIDGSKGFHSPVHMALVDDAGELEKLEKTLDIVRADDPRLPLRVVRKLQTAGELRRL